MRRTLTYLIVPALLVMADAFADPTGPDRLVWPAAPDPARIEYLGAIDCDDLSPAGGFFKKVTRWIGGADESDKLSLPFDLVSSDGLLYMVCQNMPALVAIDLDSRQFKRYQSKDEPLRYPVSLCDGGGGTIFVTDSEAGTVFRFHDGRIEPFLTDGVIRPTGIAALPDLKRLYVVDTGDQNLKVFSYEGVLLFTSGVAADGSSLLNYPSFAYATADGEVLVNDCLNYQIKRFDADGQLLGAFGREGDGPGTFSRPKGVAVDSDDHVYVVDNLFDNIQIFDPEGQVLLALGSAGNSPGQFWSPAGIDIQSDTIYVADTHNHRIQILHYLGDRP